MAPGSMRWRPPARNPVLQWCIGCRRVLGPRGGYDGPECQCEAKVDGAGAFTCRGGWIDWRQTLVIRGNDFNFHRSVGAGVGRTEFPYAAHPSPESAL